MCQLKIIDTSAYSYISTLIQRMTFLRKSVRTTHLWLGLISGIIVFIVCITGCLFAFKKEITNATEPWRFVSVQNTPQLLPSKILEIAKKEILNKQPTALTYGESNDAIVVDYFTFGNKEEEKITCYINPYTGEIQKLIRKKNTDFDFFDFVIRGHRSLWLPPNIGKPIVGYGVLLFVITLITGIVIWYPKVWNKATIKRSFAIKRKAGKTKRIFDLHNVLGFYVFLFLLILSLTGLMRSFDWFSKSVYWLTSGGKTMESYQLPYSDTLSIKVDNSLDKLYLQLKKAEPNAKTFYFSLPVQSQDAFRVSIVHEKDSYYKTDNLFFDRYSLLPLAGSGPFAGNYKEKNNADKLQRMNLDIHTGKIWGISGKIIAFSASLIGASLPVTGIYILIKRRKRKRYQ